MRTPLRSFTGLACWLALTIPLGAFAAPSLSGEAFRPVQWGPALVSSQFVEYSVAVSSSGGASDQGFVNVVRDDGTWVVQNLAVGFEPGTRTMATNVDSALFASGANYLTSFSTAPQAAAPVYTPGSVHLLGAAVSYLANNPAGRVGKGIFATPGLPSNVALNFGPVLGISYHTGMPDLAQGPNECGPTSAANSLTWLNNTFNLGLNMNTAAIRDTLKDATHMQTDPATGTTDANFVAGKNAFVAENNLPIVTHAIGGGAGGPSIASILAEMNKGQDVELAMSWGNGGGHWVTLVGVFDLGAFGAGIAFNDPDDGKDQTNFSWLDGDNGFSIRSYGVANGGNVVDFAIAESVPEPSTCLMLGMGALVLAVRARKSPACAAQR
jgi:hypothetical protein